MDCRDEREQEFQRVYAQVNLDAIVGNAVHMKEHVDPHTRIICVVKADAYGHGSVPVARCLEALDFIFGFAVATAEEAEVLLQAGIRKPILILGYTAPYYYRRLAGMGVRPAVFREDMLEEMSREALAVGRPIRVHIKVDTGMNRIGITPDEKGIAFIRHAAELPGIEIEGIFTHFARADERDKTSAYAQMTLFREFIRRAEDECGVTFPIRHCSNSASIIEIPEANMDAVRPGILLYGVAPSDEVDGERISCTPALSLHSHITYVKPLPKGQSVSYGGTFTASQDMRIATVPVGYGDGYPRSLSNRGYVLIRGCRAPIVGRVCMDQFMVDVTGIPGASEQDRVTLIGRDGEEEITAEDLGELSGRFAYELLCDLNRRIPRVYVREGRVVAEVSALREEMAYLRQEEAPRF